MANYWIGLSRIIPKLFSFDHGGSPSHILSSHGVDQNRHQDQRALLSQLGRTDVIVDLARWAGVNGSDEGFACDMTSSKYIFLGSLGLHMYYIQLVCTHTYIYVCIYIYTQYPQKYPQLHQAFSGRNSAAMWQSRSCRMRG
jgi:hypothetical protein